MSQLENKTALITGGSRGIGRASAVALGKAGARVIVHYGKAREQAEETFEAIRKDGGKADAVGSDLAAPDGPAQLAESATRISGGHLDVLVLNAGISKAGTIEEHTIADFDALFATNVRAPFFVLQQLLPTLDEGASVIVTTSLAARTPPGNAGHPDAPSLPAYAATKGALETFVRHWAAALGTKGIRVNAVAPGVIETDMSSFTKLEAGRSITLDMQALKRIGQPEDVADVIVFLASDSARWITGASIPVDGGSKI